MNEELKRADDEISDVDQTDDEIIADAKEYLELVEAADGDNGREAREDLRMLSGDHWPETAKRERALDGRPALVANKLPTFLAQVTNDQRMNRTTIKVSPVGDGADIDTAEVIQGMIKHIEYDSGADIATDTAVNSAAAIGFGYYRIMPEYCSDKSFNQDLRYKRIRNVFTVAYDPGSVMPDGSDQLRCLIHSKMPRKEFKRQYPNAKGGDTSIGAQVVQNWLSDAYMRVGEFYRVEKKVAELVMLSDGGIFYRDELPDAEVLKSAGITEVNTRQSFKTRVMWYKITAYEVLERTEIKCKWIPVFPVFGTELDIDGEVIRKGIIRDARDPQLMYDYWMTSATEEVAMRNKTPYIGAKGQFSGNKSQWNQANNRSFPFLEYDPVTIDGTMAPAPQRQPMADIPNGMLTMAMHANDNIKATTGLFDSSLGMAGNATSGRQELAQQHQGNISNFHYQDGLKRTQRHAGRCLIDMIPNYYDTHRVVNIMREDGEIVPMPINKPLSEEEALKLQQDRKAKAPQGASPAIQKVLNDVTTGEFAVVCDTGPSYSTMRKEAADAMIQFGQSWPKLMDVAGDKVVKAMDWPGAEGIAQRIERTIPPEILYDPKDPNAGPPPLPPQVKQQMDMMQQQLQQANEEIKQLKSGVEKEHIKAQTAEYIAEMKAQMDQSVAQITAESKKDVAEIAGLVQILVAKMNPPPDVKSAADTAMGENESQGA